MAGGVSDPAARKRARLVCFRCHSKKVKPIKCDLVDSSASRPCSNCAQAETPCRLRPSRRGLGRRRSRYHHQIELPHEPLVTEVAAASPEATSITVVGGPSQDQNGPPPRTDRADHLQSPLGAHTAFGAADLEGAFPGEYQLPAVNYQPLTPSPAPSHHSSTPITRTKQLSVQATSFGDGGYMEIFSRDNVVDEDEVQQAQLVGVEPVPIALQESFIDTYFNYCYCWCPVLDNGLLHGCSGMEGSPLLHNALALCGTRINPPLIRYRDPITYYSRAKELFYNNYEGRALVRLASIMLFFWWSTGAPNQLNTDNAWWWMGIAVRVAQECGLHREPQSHQLTQPWETAGLRRRIWWTLFARDRILSLSQGRPTIIDTDFCDVAMVTAQDFPDPSDPKAQIFIHWVRLLDIGGRISKHLSRKAGDRTNTASLARELTSWVQSLPGTISLSSVRTARTTAFDRDSSRLHITYLAHVMLLHMTRSSQLPPRASTAAIVAASCMARLFEDLLARGNVRFLTGDAGWEIAVALLALLHARRVREDLRTHAEADFQTLLAALRQMALLWPSSRMLASAFDKLSGAEDSAPMASRPTPQHQNNINNEDTSAVPGEYRGENVLDMMGWTDNEESTEWIDAFPFVTNETSPLISAVLAGNLAMPCPDLNWPLDITVSLQEFLQPGDFSFDMLDL